MCVNPLFVLSVRLLAGKLWGSVSRTQNCDCAGVGIPTYMLPKDQMYLYLILYSR